MASIRKHRKIESDDDGIIFTEPMMDRDSTQAHIVGRCHLKKCTPFCPSSLGKNGIESILYDYFKVKDFFVEYEDYKFRTTYNL